MWLQHPKNLPLIWEMGRAWPQEWHGQPGVEVLEFRAICAPLPNVHGADSAFPLETFNIPDSAGENHRKGGVSDEQARSCSLFFLLKAR